ncbi:Spc98 family-domain-containing protein [Fomitopsis serialis]|uniref:Spc98 family-domain-containing protein n=1 Tax=Fomitopsis serialis TaxID=139415 RepID=UPI002007454A|nr:Spc98 family-domain-containing protein [Neoantrodia serialis]KAH9935387.1 Spc98 family-domain-containing protein [Neoantrodia serialis]
MAESILPDLQGLETSQLDTLPEIHPGFFVPRLTDKPQNPIMDTIQLMQRTRDSLNVTYPLPVEVEALAEDMWAVAEARRKVQNDIWQQAATEKSNSMHCLMSWETLRSSFNSRTIPSAFLSQQDTRVFASVRHYVRPQLHDSAKPLVYVSGSELIQSLHLTLTGMSSSTHIWDPRSEQFTLRAVPRGTRGKIVLIGTDEVISESVLQRFVNIGTLMRRLENLTQSHNTMRGRAAQVTHSFIHALSSVLDSLRKRLAKPMRWDTNSEDTLDLVAVWMRYAATEEILLALAALCNRDMHELPSVYSPLPTTVVDLLSRIYRQLDESLENHSPHALQAILAYILTVTSQDYFQQLSQSVGYNMSPTHNTDPAMHDSGLYGTDHLDEEPDDERDETFYDDPPADEPCPVFIQEALASAFPRAKRSLKFLREAQPDHPLLHGYREDCPDVHWFWTDADVATAWTGRKGSLGPVDLPAQHPDRDSEADPPLPDREYREELKDFALFDLTPGQNLGLFAPPASQTDSTEVGDLQAFMNAFPSTLPSLTPTLSHLTALVLSPLAHHMEALSGALVTLILSPTDLSLPLHLSVLRSYLLLTSHAFKSRLSAALFSDSDDPPNSTTRASAASHRKAEASTPLADGHWAVGLSPALTAASVWPPSVPELSFHLRTVINDSLQSSFGLSFEQTGLPPRQESIIHEAEYRLGFAIRDLPTGTGKEKWLDPLSIEALDFLYMDYKPPRPLHVVITPDALSKYHRIFAFNLRLMRATCAMSATYRITRRSTSPLFPTLFQTNKLLLHARFVATAFVTTLSSYIYDRAIGLRFDAFLAKLNVPEQNRPPGGFSDVFVLADYHSSVLDDILSACLLRSGQKAVGDVLRGCLELVLELAVLAGDRYQGRLEEYQAAPLLEDLWEKFRKRTLTLIKVLRALVERGSGTSREAVEDVAAQLANLSRLDGVTGSLHDLVTRLDVAEWWIRK